MRTFIRVRFLSTFFALLGQFLYANAVMHLLPQFAEEVKLISQSSNSVTAVPVGNISRQLYEKLNQTKHQILLWALTVDGTATQDSCDTPNRMSCDETFWNGILCSNPHIDANILKLACQSALPRAQSHDGMLWRSPWEAAAGNSSNPDFFSRDQGLATLASLTRTKNASLYEPWLKYISSHNGYMCPKYWDCTLVAPFWCTFDNVAKYANLTRPDPHLMVPRLGAGVCNNDHTFVYISCSVNDQGSALHLASLDVYIRRQIGAWDAVLQAAANKLHSREPQNVWFEWLSRGASDSLAERLISQVPVYNASTSKRLQWSFVRQDSEKAYKESMGWEFIFLIDHLLASPIV